MTKTPTCRELPRQVPPRTSFSRAPTPATATAGPCRRNAISGAAACVEDQHLAQMPDRHPDCAFRMSPNGGYAGHLPPARQFLAIRLLCADFLREEDTRRARELGQGPAEPVVCSLPYSGQVPADLPCPLPWSKSAVTPSQPASAKLEVLAVKIASQDYPGYTVIFRSPPDSLMIEAGLWIELEAIVTFTVGLGLASLMGQRTIPVTLLFVFQIIVTPILSAVDIPHLQDLQRSIVGLAVARLEPSGLPTAAAVPGVTGGVATRGGGPSLLPESATEPSASSSPGWQPGRSSARGE
jgi:hypothetical protein